MIAPRAAAWLVVATGLVACTPPPPPSAQSRAAQATLSACRQRADQIYAQQNRASLYLQDNRDAPESASYQSGITTRGLAARYGWDTDVSDCIRSQSASDAQGTNGSGATPASASGQTPR